MSVAAPAPAGRVVVYLGGATRHGGALEASVHRSHVARVADALAGQYGGATVTYGEGRWDGRAEPTAVVEAWVMGGLLHPRLARSVVAVVETALVATCQDAALVIMTDANGRTTYELVTAPDHDGVVVSTMG